MRLLDDFRHDSQIIDRFRKTMCILDKKSIGDLSLRFRRRYGQSHLRFVRFEIKVLDDVVDISDAGIGKTVLLGMPRQSRRRQYFCDVGTNLLLFISSSMYTADQVIQPLPLANIIQDTLPHNSIR